MAIPLESLHPCPVIEVETRCKPGLRRLLLLLVMCALIFRASEQLLPGTGQHKPDALLRLGDRPAPTQLVVPAKGPADDRAALRDQRASAVPGHALSSGDLQRIAIHVCRNHGDGGGSALRGATLV